MTDKTPRKTLKITRKRTTATNAPEEAEKLPTATLGSKKRVLTFDKPVKKQPQPPAKKKKRVAPSVIRSSDLNKVLSAHSKAWRSYSPMDSGIERQIFQFIGANHLKASKRIVKALIKKHVTAVNYLKHSTMDSPIFDLNDNQTGLVSWEHASLAAKLLVKVEAQREADKRAKRRKK